MKLFTEQVTRHTDLQMHKRKFFSIKCTCRYSYAKFGIFFMCHPVITIYWM